MPSCVCQRQCIIYNKRTRRHICGSNGKLYVNFCELYRDECLTGSPITISDMSLCEHSVENTRSCSDDEYAIMKDNLLLFHHQNMAYLQHGPDGHSMDYLVSIIFSHYDQNNDGLVEKDELALMWNTMDIYRVANGSNCTLLDMLFFDDANFDDVLTINEFNDAFRRISETQKTNKKTEILKEEVVPEVYLDAALITNHIDAQTGDKIEIHCDITGVSTSVFVWKRFGYNLSQMMNETDEYDDGSEDKSIQEIKILNDGGIYILNAQMKHAGNYSCQVSSNEMIIQTHILRVHGKFIKT